MTRAGYGLYLVLILVFGVLFRRFAHEDATMITLSILLARMMAGDVDNSIKRRLDERSS